MKDAQAYTPTCTQPDLPCPVCRGSLTMRLAHGRKSGKPFLMVICPQDGRHFRGFINDQVFMRGVLDRLEALGQNESSEEHGTATEG
jgi:hypothetical protein